MSSEVEMGGTDCMDIDNEGGSRTVPGPIRRDVFPFTKVNKNSPNYDRFCEALETVMITTGFKDLDPEASSVMSVMYFWIDVLEEVGIVADEGIRAPFRGTNEQSVQEFARLVENRYSAPAAFSIDLNLDSEREKFSTEFVEKQNAVSMLDQITDYST
jgi:hypothetical protein